MCSTPSCDKYETGLSLDEACRDVLDAVEPIGGREGYRRDKRRRCCNTIPDHAHVSGVWNDGEITIGIGPNDVDLDSMD